MNRVVLLLNVTVLVVSFVLALTATDAQIGIMRSGVAYGARVPARAATAGVDPSPAILRVVQALPGFAPAPLLERMTPERMRAIHAAVAAYYGAVRRGVQGADADLRAYGLVGRAAREEVESVLAEAFDDGPFVQRLVTEILRAAR